jgi:hypothetical protein
MHSVLRLSLWAAAALLAAFGVCAAVRGECLAHEAKLLLVECERAAALEAEVSANRSLSEHKWAVVASLVAGRLSLAEAAEGLHQAEVTTHGDFRFVRRAYEGLSEEEAAYRHAITWARCQLSHDPASATGVLARLQAEFEARFHHPLPPARGPRGAATQPSNSTRAAARRSASSSVL